MVGYVKKNKKWLVLYLIILLLSNLLAIVVQFLKGDVLNLALEHNFNRLIIYTTILLFAILSEVLFTYYSFKFENIFKNNCIKDIRKDLFETIFNLDHKEILKNETGNFISKFTVTLQEIKNKYIGNITLLIMFLFKIIFVSTALFVLNWKLAIITLFLLTMPLYIPKIFEKKLIKYQNEFTNESNINMNFLINVIDGIEIIKNFMVEHIFIGKFNNKNNKLLEITLKNDNYNALLRIVMAIMSYFSYFSVVAFSAYLVYNKTFNAGQFFIAVGMIDQLSYPIIAIAEAIQNLISIKQLKKEFGEFIHFNKDKKSYFKITSLMEKIELRNIYFKYNLESDWILSDCSMKFEKGKKYLLIGDNGTGKTTLINCLLKYFTPSQGDILIDGNNLENYKSLYDLCSIMRQNIILLPDTLRNNVSMYRIISDEKIIDILSKLKLNKFASKIGIDTIIGVDGISLSGGEVRKIGLARTLLSEKEVLIFDEPLANLDIDSKEAVKHYLMNCDKTVIIISHDWIDNEIDINSFDKIYYMDKFNKREMINNE